MKTQNLSEMVKGWFVGGFSPAAFNTTACEVAVKHYQAGEVELPHFHKVATEITVVISGNVRMAGRDWGAGDIIILEPGEVSGFEALTESINVVVKVPGALNDNYLASAD